MLLVVDIGNTHTVLGIYDQDRLIHMWRLATNVEYTSDELRIKLRALLSAEEIDAGVIKGAILCSVVPALTHNWEKACERSFGAQLRSLAEHRQDFVRRTWRRSRG